MPYVSFISDDHFRQCVGNLYNSYVSAHRNVDRAKFYSNKIDVIKLSFDKYFEQLSEDELIKRDYKTNR